MFHRINDRSFKLKRRRNERRFLFADRLEPRLLLAGDMIAHWMADRLADDDLGDGASLTKWTDSVSGLESIATGTPTLEASQFGGRAMIRFDASDGVDSFELNSNVNPLTRADDFSVIVVFRTDANDLIGGNDQWFQNTGIVDSNRKGIGHDWGFSINAAGQLSTGMGAGFGIEPRTVYSSVSSINDGQLHTAIITRSGSTLSLSIDDQPVDSRDDMPATTRSNLPLTMGALTEQDFPYSGDIAQVRFYNGALDENESTSIRKEIETYYNNAAPQANDDIYELNEDTLLFPVNSQNGLLANDSDADGDPIVATLVTSPAAGAITLRDDGSFIYRAPKDFFGVDTFTYTANDHRPSEVATVSINVLPTYDPPIPMADNYKMRPNGTLNIPTLVGLLANDQNPDNAELIVTQARPVSDGELTLNSNGSFVYDPNGFEGVATFAYQIDDGTQVTGPIEVAIAVNTPPVATDDNYRLAEDEVLDVDATNGIISNDQDAQADNQLSARLIAPTANGSVDLQPDGSFVYTPNAEYSGIDSFTYRLSDGFEDSGIATVTLTVESVDDPPQTMTDAYFTLPSQPLEISAEAGLLANDLDIEGHPLTARLSTAPTNGMVTVRPDGSFTYQANAQFEGRDSFSYIASDASSDSDPTTVFIDVAAQPVVISEFLAVNSESLPTRLRETAEDRFRGEDLLFDWIELKNLLDVDLNLSGIHLTDDASDPIKWVFPPGTIIPANQFLVVFASGLNVVDTSLDEQGLLHTSFKIGSEGEYLALTSQSGSVIDSFEASPVQFRNVSYGRLNEQASYFATATPGLANQDPRSGRANEVSVEPSHGFFDSPIQVQVATDNPVANIRYTLDGSEPTATNGNDYSEPITISSTSTLRVTSLVDSLLPAPVATNSYIFLDDVLQQSPDGSAPTGWPDRPVRGQSFDYGMDPEIVNDPNWGPQLKDALTQIPAISLVLEQEDLTGAQGIYVNAMRDGRGWERPTSVELVYPDGTTGFQIDAGLRIRGGFSRAGFNPKHSFRLFFRDEYEGPLDYALFEDEGADQFRAVDLRTAQNYAWSNDTFNDQTRNSFLRDIYSRDLQRELGQPYTRGRYYHLYLNGQYWGLFQTEERPEASYAETYLGANSEDYDVIKASGGILEATDGELQPWRDLWEIANQGFDSLDDYFLIQGKNPDGTDNRDLPVHVQMDNVIDFAINYMFTGNQDMPTSLGNSSANNFWAIRNPNSREGWQFIAHDNEHNMLSTNDDQTRDDPAGNVFGSFNPKYLHQQLDQLAEYRLRFADRIQKHFFHDGAVTRERAQARMQTRVDQIDQAIIAESARWGDQHNEPPLTKETWLAEVDWLLNNFLANRTQVVLDQFRNRGLYPDVAAPELNQHGGMVNVGFSLTMTAPTGTIYYTLDGQDPREIGGSINAEARTWTADSDVELVRDTTVKSRVWNGTDWSALTEAQFLVGQAIAPTPLRISEIHYHPLPPTEPEESAGFEDDDDFEFMELVNTSDQPLDLARAKFVRNDVGGNLVGVDFDFAQSPITRLGAGERILLVENHAAFEFRYGQGLPIAGQWSGGLSNAGELLTLLVDGQVLQQFTYDDAWVPSSDGGGPSMEIVEEENPNLESWGLAQSWRASAISGGTPGRPPRVIGDVNGDGRFDSSDLVLIFQAGKYEDGIPNNAVFEEGDWNNDGDFDSTDLVVAFQAGTFVAAGKRVDLQMAATDSIFADPERSD